MAGKIQHEIPQLFQRGFLIPNTGTAERIFIFRRGGGVFPSNIDRSGAESYFYSEPRTGDQKTLDDELTTYEGRLGPLVERLRATPVGGLADPEIAAEVVAHLTTRNAHLRGVLAHGIVSMAEGMRHVFSDEDNMRRLVGLAAPSVTDVFRKHLGDAILAIPAIAALDIPPALLEKFAFAAAREGFSPFFTQQLPGIEGMLGLLSAGANDHARDGHRKMLAKSAVSDVRMAMLSNFEWRVISSDSDLILPDCVALAIDISGDIHPLMMAPPNDIAAVILPLTSRTLLVGSRDFTGEFDPRTFNRLAAQCSHTYFLCASQSGDVIELTALTRQRSVTVVERAIANGLSQMLPPTPGDTAAETPLQRSTFSIPVFYRGAFDEETVSMISQALSNLMGDAAWTMPLDRLDGITIADDYLDALATLDRGKLGIGVARSRQDDKTVGVAQPVNVMRDGVLKSHIVIAGFLGRSLLSDSEIEREYADYVVANQLAHAGFTQIFDEVLPGVLLSRIDGLDGLMQRCTYPAWNSYFAGRAAGPFVGSHHFEDEQDVILTALDELFTEVPKARTSYRSHGDIDRFLDEILPRVEFFLEHAAGLLGSADALNEDVFARTPALTEELDRRQLKAWYSDFRRDLVYLWNRRGRWESYTEFLALNRHAERILWMLPVLPWMTPDGLCRIEVPILHEELE